jgi:hypothetical protein
MTRVTFMICLASALGRIVATAQAPQPPYALFQQATLTGSGNTINATQIPVVTSSGAIVYLNAALQFNVDANGNLTISSGFPQIAASPSAITSGFRAGTYVGPSTILGGKSIVSVSGPGVADGGYTIWSLTTGSGAAGSTYPSSATWYTGPVANTPLAARINKAGITSPMMSFGVGSSQQPDTSVAPAGYQWWSCPSTLFGVSQVNNTITFVSFTSSNCTDYGSPQSQITFTLAPTQ